MQELVIGIPARDEEDTVVQVAAALELGTASLGEGIRCELALAYQSGSDGTLDRWHSRRFRLRNRVLRGPEGAVGKGRNVKLLIRHALETDAHLLLVDADLYSYPPSNVARFVTTDRLLRGGIVLPLWCRPRGQGNSTDFLACPVLFAHFGALIRQPLAGQMLLTKRMLETIDLESLPDDYGIDVALTMQALNRGLPVDQVTVPFPGHEAGGNSRQIMEHVAGTVLGFVAGGAVTRRVEVRWPDAWWEDQPAPPVSSRSLRGLIDQLVPPGQVSKLEALLDAPPEEVRDFWCDHLAAAVRLARAGGPIESVVADLVIPFLVHAEYRRRLEVELADAEGYVWELCTRLSEAIS